MADEIVDDTFVADIGEPPIEPDPLLDRPSASEDAYNEPLKPSIDETVGLIGPGLWSIGSLIFCKILQVGESLPSDTVCHWSADDTTYYLQKRSPPRVDTSLEGDFLASRYYGGVSRGIWNLGENTFCKVKSWVEGMTTEATTIRWVNKNVPSVPTEEIIYDWIDPKWNRTIMISKRVPGLTYQKAWSSLTKNQRLDVAEQVAGHFKALAEMTSDYVETVEGAGIAGTWSLRVREEPALFWKPDIEPRVAREDYEAYIKRSDARIGMKSVTPGIGEPLVLQHPDCCPVNFLVTVPSDPDQMPRVTGIIDWERVGYLPKHLVATTPRSMKHFMVDADFGEDETWEHLDWRWMLSNACVKVGFPLELDYTKEWWRRRLRHYPGIPIESVVCCDYLPTELGIFAEDEEDPIEIEQGEEA